MSADDFQSKYASVMESMLKSAVSETTKLFETMVDELKAEIAKMKKENEELKARCNQFERTEGQGAVCLRESEPPPGRRDTSERRDTAVQCGELWCSVVHRNLTNPVQCRCRTLLVDDLAQMGLLV